MTGRRDGEGEKEARREEVLEGENGRRMTRRIQGGKCDESEAEKR